MDIVPIDVEDSVDIYPEVVSAIFDVDPNDVEASLDVKPDVHPEVVDGSSDVVDAIVEVCSIVNSDDFGGVAEVVEEYFGVQLVAKSFQVKEEELTTNSVPLGPMILSVPSLISFPNSVKASEVV